MNKAVNTIVKAQGKSHVFASPHGKAFFISNSAHPCTEIALDANRIRAFYIANGWRETVIPGDADDLIVSTCAYNQEYEDAGMADLEARKRMLKPGARLIATGCLSKIHPERFARVGADDAVGPLELDRFDKLITAELPMKDVSANEVRIREYEANPFFLKIVKAKEKLEKLSRKIGLNMVPHWMATIPSADWFFIRGAVGCRGRCTYCAVRRAKGTLVSTPRDVILRQTEDAKKRGVSEISLAGDDMGAWGSDIDSDLAELLKAMITVGPGFSINIRFVEPLYLIKLTDKLLPIFETGRISAFCLPIQSGSNAVLSRMNRDYTIEAVEAALMRIADIPRRPRIASIIMTGFPGETEADFHASCALLNRLPIDLYQILAYEGRPGTPSISMADQVSEEVKRARHDCLLRKFKLQKVVGLPHVVVDRICGLNEK
ncbi:MAG: radical SAM protein [Candidatus Riflebacteria bacterium]|nr:radical SAM protein [Candidatus Riflebacteria bacterium]